MRNADPIQTHSSPVAFPFRARAAPLARGTQPVWLVPCLALAQPSPTQPSLAPQFTDLFWALLLLAAFVVIGIIWVGIVRRNVWQRTELIRQREAAKGPNPVRGLLEGASEQARSRRLRRWIEIATDTSKDGKTRVTEAVSINVARRCIRG